MTNYKGFIRLCRRTKKCLEAERAYILKGDFDQIGPVLEEKENLIRQVMEQADLLTNMPPAQADKSSDLATTILREVIKAAEENSIVLSGALRGLQAGRSRQSQKKNPLMAYTASGDHGLATPSPINSEAIA